MRELDRDGRILCELQGHIFEKSAEAYTTSSAIFIRRFMNSDYAARMDRDGFIDRPTDAEEAFASIDEQYGSSSYGSEIYSADELFWIGYIYRYWVYIYEVSSKAVYRQADVSLMHSVFYAYHTLDPMNAIHRIMEAKDMNYDLSDDEQILAAVEILRRIRRTDLET